MLNPIICASNHRAAPSLKYHAFFLALAILGNAFAEEASWTPVEKVAKNNKGKYQALLNGAWVPVQKVKKNADGKYVAFGIQSPTDAAIGNQNSNSTQTDEQWVKKQKSNPNSYQNETETWLASINNNNFFDTPIGIEFYKAVIDISKKVDSGILTRVEGDTLIENERKATVAKANGYGKFKSFDEFVRQEFSQTFFTSSDPAWIRLRNSAIEITKRVDSGALSWHEGLKQVDQIGQKLNALDGAISRQANSNSYQEKIKAWLDPFKAANANNPPWWDFYNDAIKIAQDVESGKTTPEAADKLIDDRRLALNQSIEASKAKRSHAEIFRQMRIDAISRLSDGRNLPLAWEAAFSYAILQGDRFDKGEISSTEEQYLISQKFADTNEQEGKRISEMFKNFQTVPVQPLFPAYRAPLRIPQTDFTCLNDCTNKGYMYQLCTQRCSY